MYLFDRFSHPGDLKKKLRLKMSPFLVIMRILYFILHENSTTSIYKLKKKKCNPEQVIDIIYKTDI